ncbi:MAG: tripartite tricarboxylate transporter substrate binding protein [Xanthobacteraceae bacterium]|nr:tripartite tricarboxylate transporter substrate binding protein [Xanthobacteraceae bacterium]
MLLRRQLLRIAAAAAVVPATRRIARAQAYPRRPVRLIVSSAAGGTPDIVGRLIGQWLQERVGQSFVIENRSGAGGNIGSEAAVRAPADGYTLLLVAPSNAVNATLYQKLSFSFLRDAAPIAGLARASLVLEVTPSFPVTSVPEFIAYAKHNPGKINLASAGNGSIQHIAGELFKMMTGVDMLHVPYRSGAPAMTDLLAGQVQAMFNTIPTSIGYLRNGGLRALGVSGRAPEEVLPDVPPLAEFVPGYEASSWYGLAAPKGTPDEIVAILNNAVNAGLADPKLKAQLADQGATVFPCSPAEFGRFVAAETDKWGRVVRFAGLRPD